MTLPQWRDHVISAGSMVVWCYCVDRLSIGGLSVFLSSLVEGKLILGESFVTRGTRNGRNDSYSEKEKVVQLCNMRAIGAFLLAAVAPPKLEQTLLKI